MIKLSQRDPQWSSKKLGISPHTVGQYGCTTTAISAFSHWYGCYKDPGVLARSLSYTKTGLLIWSSIANVLCCKFKWRFYSFDKKMIDTALKSKDEVVLLNVDRGYHWVSALYPIPFTNKYYVMNPWTGKNEIYDGVVGGAILTRK